MKRLSDEVAIVTGSTSGIGAGVARQLALEGAAVVINGRDVERGNAVVQQITDAGGRAKFLPGSVLSQEDMKGLVAESISAFGQVDILVASASGVTQAQTRSPKCRGLFHEIDIASVVDVVGLATTGKLVPTQAVVPHMIERGKGSIVFITSEGGRVPTQGQTTVAFYAGGLIMGTKLLARELAQHRIRVNCVAITLVDDTPAWDGSEGRGDPMTPLHRAQYMKIRERAPLGIARPDDIGATVAFLASGASGFVTGTTIGATGGLTIG